MSVTPSLLPRSWVQQGWITAASAVVAYACGVMLAWAARRARLPPLTRRMRRRLWCGIGAAAVIVIPLSVWFGARWQDDVRRVIGMPGERSYLYICSAAFVIAVLLALVAVARLVHALNRDVARRARKYVGPVAGRLVAAAAVAMLVASVVTGWLSEGVAALADSGYAALDNGTDPGVVHPASPLRSGSPGSLVSWSSLGIRGRAFVAGGPSVADIERISGHPAIMPIRVYAGTSSAGTFQAEANLVLAELKRTGAFQRELIAIGTPPGEGGLDESLTTPLEYMFSGDTAIAAMQYSHLPSWLSFVVDESRARDSSRTLFDTVYAYWSTLPPAHRPRLVVFGMSLGALGAADAFSGVGDITKRTSGALFVGTPNDTTLWQHLTAARVARSREILPLYGDGQTVRFAASPDELRRPDGSLLAPRVVFLQHATDPVVWWSPSLVWRQPDWLSEPRGPGVLGGVHWFSLVTFCQLVGDLQVGANPPPHYGHHYAPSEVVTAWAAILHPPLWTDADTSALIAKG